MQTSAALQRIQPSATLAMTSRVFELKRQGIDVIGLGAGEPDFDTADFVKEAAIEAIRAGKTKYTNVDGTPELKQAIVAKFARDNGLTYAENQISVNSGGNHSLFNASCATIDPGDEVIVPAPYWVSYTDVVEFAGGTPVFVSAGAEQNYKLRPEQLEAAIDRRARLVAEAIDRAALDVLHYEIEPPVLRLTAIEQPRHVRVIERRQNPPLPREPLMRIRRRGMRVHQLQRPPLLVLPIGALHQEHRAHAAVTHAPQHAPRANPLAIGWIAGQR
jgi:hypothetical protein